MKNAAINVMLGITLLTGGCHSVGPMSLARDRSDYSAGISESWKRQMLLNIVKLRYVDPPVFVDVGQIVSGYTLETGVNIGGSIAQTTNVGGNTLSLGGSSKFTDRPTITYSPLTGSRFISGIVSPIAPSSLFHAIQSGWPADVILTLGVSNINGHKNEDVDENGAISPASPEFVRITQIMRRLQANGAVSIRIVEDEARKLSTLVVLRSPSIPPDLDAEADELRTLVGLGKEGHEFNLVYGSLPSNPRELAVQTRSLLRVMGMFAHHVEVPATDVTEGRAPPGRIDLPERSIRIYSGRHAPPDAFVSVHYRNLDFWVDDRDLTTKRAIGLMLLIFTMADTGTSGGPALLTIPTG